MNAFRHLQRRMDLIPGLNYTININETCWTKLDVSSNSFQGSQLIDEFNSVLYLVSPHFQAYTILKIMIVFCTLQFQKTKTKEKAPNNLSLTTNAEHWLNIHVSYRDGELYRRQREWKEGSTADRRKKGKDKKINCNNRKNIMCETWGSLFSRTYRPVTRADPENRKLCCLSEGSSLDTGLQVKRNLIREGKTLWSFFIWGQLIVPVMICCSSWGFHRH